MSGGGAAPQVQSVPERLAFDVQSLGRYLETAIPNVTGDLGVSKFTGGQSNPTYRLDTSLGRLVLRRKPPGSTLASAHAIDREARAMRALRSVGFPVPKVLVECGDASVIGSPFYIMEYLDGRIYWDPLLPECSPEERRALYFALTDALAELHSVDIDAAGLADFGPRGNYYARQIERWTAQYKAGGEAVPEMERLAEWLAANVPDDDHVAIVHGDYRLDNVVFHTDRSEIIGVIDWELATLGNPRADLSYFLLNWIVPLDPLGRSSLIGADLDTLGIPTAVEIVDRYFEKSAVPKPTSFAFDHAYNMFRVAAILHGIAARARAGNAASERAQAMGALIRPAIIAGCRLAQIV